MSECTCVCSHCGREFPCVDLIEFDDELWCKDCLVEQTVICDVCGDRVYRDNAASDDSITICNSCFENNYFFCSGCGHLYHTRYYHGDGICDCCFSERYGNVIQSYTYKPECWQFYKADCDPRFGNLFFGVELEYSFFSEESCLCVARDVVDDINGSSEEKYCVLKHDGSLSDGFEIVTQPMTLNFWRLRGVDIFRSALRRIADNCDQDYSDGIHIHISRRSMRAGHKVRFGSFFAMFQESMVQVAGRYSDRYAAYKTIPDCGKDCINTLRNYDRYEAVNWENSSTVEIRIFRATTDWGKIMAYIELCHAIYQYTKQSSIARILDCRAWQEFLDFVRAEPKYDHLYQYMQTLGFYRDK